VLRRSIFVGESKFLKLKVLDAGVVAGVLFRLNVVDRDDGVGGLHSWLGSPHRLVLL
jgi:hypothetical protein